MSKLLSALLLLPLALGGCAVNPVTGEQELSLISESQEISIGSQEYAPARQAQGGDYVVDPQVQRYVNDIGQRLAAKSDRKLPYEFKVLNNSVPNAWALPGGKIAINRGLLTELKNEAELAAVLGHEVVHAAAKHGAKSMQRGLLLQGAVVAATIATQDRDYANVAQLGASLGAQLINQKYGRDAERESDHYGMIYMSRAGYDPQGAVGLQETFVKLSEGRNQDWLSGLFASHPPSAERVANNRRDAATLPKGGEIGAARYQHNLKHLLATKPAYDAYDEAEQALAKGDTSRATELVRNAIRIEPREAHFHSLLGDIELKNRRLDAARGHYTQAINLNDDFFYYHLRRGLVNAELDAADAARRDLERSVQLLPTADAYNSLGNIARAQRQFAQAKQYYARAADNDSTAGRAAYGALVDLDLSDNPQNYLQLRMGLGAGGRLVIEINNPTPRDVTAVAIALQYPDTGGQMRQLRQTLSGRLAAGQKTTLNTDIAIDTKQVERVQGAIVAARVAP